ncbi:MAG: Fe-S protein assembly chaperone HscA [Alphaproteobacteria bacterium]|nr:Fe-S protein assembly chaperone HscA [Alphaproteobacteria bacterium]
MLLQITEPKGKSQEIPEYLTKSIGIDLGTTHSVIAYVKEGVPEIIPSQEGKPLIPSVVAYQNNEVLAGDEISDLQTNVIRSIKRLMGRGLADIQTLQGIMPYEFQKDQDNQSLLRLNIDGQLKTAIEISADLLKKLKRDAEAYLGHPVTQAVITVPAYFDEAQRAATKDAARLAGLDVLRLLSEPTAAALAYGLDQNKEGVYAIYDLGGGTFDISILKLEKGVFRVLATGGNARLGGDDIDLLIVDDYLKKHNKSIESQQDLKRLLQLAKKLKEALTENETAGFEDYILTKTDFNNLIEPITNQTITLFEQTLKDAQLNAKNLNGIVLVGGSTRIPYISESLKQAFNQKPLSDLNPDEIVALGAAIQAHGLTEGANHLLLDIIPLSLGIETMGGLVEKIIDRNSPIPTAKMQEFTTYVDGQTAMSLHIVQGERELAKDCRSLGHFEFKNIPPMSATMPRIQITFMVDADGLLIVSAHEETTGAKQEIVIKPSYGLDEAEITQMLYDSINHGEDDLNQRFLIELKVEAQSVLTALEKALIADKDVLTNDEKNEIVLAAEKLTFLLDSSNRDDIQLALTLLEDKAKPFVEKRLNKALSSSIKGISIDQFK